MRGVYSFSLCLRGPLPQHYDCQIQTSVRRYTYLRFLAFILYSCDLRPGSVDQSLLQMSDSTRITPWISRCISRHGADILNYQWSVSFQKRKRNYSGGHWRSYLDKRMTINASKGNKWWSDEWMILWSVSIFGHPNVRCPDSLAGPQRGVFAKRISSHSVNCEHSAQWSGACKRADDTYESRHAACLGSGTRIDIYIHIYVYIGATNPGPLSSWFLLSSELNPKIVFLSSSFQTSN